MIAIKNKIAECYPGAIGVERRRKRDPIEITGITIHRIRVDHEKGYGSGGPEIARYLRGYPKVGRMAYTFIIPYHAEYVEQCAPLLMTTPHAGYRWNRSTIGVGFEGDMRRKPVSKGQWDLGVDLCVALAMWIMRGHGWHPGLLEGHDERPDSSDDPNKACPGEWFPMDEFRDEVRAISVDLPVMGLLRAGVQF